MRQPHSFVIVYFIARHKVLFAIVIALTLLVSLLESISLGAFFPVFGVLVGDSDGNEGGFLGTITRLVSVLPISDPVISALVFLVGIIVIKTVVSLLKEGFFAYAGAKILYDAKRQVMDRYGSEQYQFFLDHGQGSLIYSGLAAPASVASFMISGAQLLSHLLKVVAICVVLGLIFPLAALALACLGIAYFVLIHFLARRVSYVLGHEQVQSSTQLLTIQNEFLNGIHQIITLGVARHWKDRFDGENQKYSRAYAKVLAWQAIPRPIMEMAAVVLMATFLIALWLIDSVSFIDRLPKLGIFGVGLFQLLPSMTAFGGGRMAMMSRLPDVELAHDTITGASSARADGFRDLDSFEHALKFENVSFSHKGREALLNDVDLTFEQGKTTAIVGPSGAGKTTIINLILGLFEPSSGRITVDGVPLPEIKQEGWLSRLGFVSQEPFTHHSTVADNILFGRDGHNMESIVNSAKIASAHGFISDLPEGYETIVGERGMKLSGGQQQRIGIARAVLNNPEILIFDEATSSLDTVSERQVQEAITNVSANRTVIIVAHRLSTVMHADKIIVLEQGRVVEEGTHQDLMRRNGDYAHMVSLNT